MYSTYQPPSAGVDCVDVLLALRRLLSQSRQRAVTSLFRASVDCLFFTLVTARHWQVTEDGRRLLGADDGGAEWREYRPYGGVDHDYDDDEVILQSFASQSHVNFNFQTNLNVLNCQMNPCSATRPLRTTTCRPPPAARASSLGTAAGATAGAHFVPTRAGAHPALL